MDFGIRIIRNRLMSKIDTTYNNFCLRVISFLSSMLLMNFSIWSSFHNTHHVFLDNVLENQFKFLVSSHDHSDDTVHHHKKTSTPNEKKHHDQSDIGCFLLNFNSAFEEYLFLPSKKIINNFKKKTKDKIFIKIFLNIIELSISEINPRGPPI